MHSKAQCKISTIEHVTHNLAFNYPNSMLHCVGVRNIWSARQAVRHPCETLRCATVHSRDDDALLISVLLRNREGEG